MKKSEVLVGKNGDGLELEIYGMDNAPTVRRAWEKAGGHKLMMATLETIQVTGKWRLILDRQVFGSGVMANVLVRHVDNDGNICLRIKPGGNDTCISCRLQAPPKVPRAMVHAVQAKLVNIETLGKTAAGDFVNIGEDGGELAAKDTPTPERGQSPDKGKLPPPMTPAPANDDDVAVRLMESARSLKSILEATVQVREIRQSIIGQQTAMDELQRKTDELMQKHRDEIAALREKEKQIIRGLSTEALYESIRLVEEAQAEIENP